jgi:catechol 2,3-dioxygenase-like lactoylglutathione lyase family enzyme
MSLKAVLNLNFAKVEPGKPMSAPGVAFSHIGIYANDLARMEDFYSRVLGLVVTDRGELPTPAGVVRLVFLSRDPLEHHQIVLASGRPENVPFNVINQISFRVQDLAALRHFARVLGDEKAGELTPVTHGNAISVYCRDPEGNRLELFFDTPWYCPQPCREPVDFGLEDAEILARTEMLARSLPGFATRADWSAALRRRIEAMPAE